MSQKYYGLVTDKGLAKLRAAAQGVGALTLSYMAFGDGSGSETAPSTTATALVGERYRTPLSDKRPHATNPSILYVEAIIPPGIGGWTLREAGIYDSDGDLIVIAKTPSMDVALLSEGASTEGLVRLPLVFESAQDVEFLIDPTVLLATQSWVIERIISRPFITVESITLTAPPAAPAQHALYVVPANATGAWAGKTHQMAYWHGAWLFADAPKAKVVGTSDTGKYYRRAAPGWAEFLGDETTPGFLQLATDAEHKAGVRRDLATHPAGVAANVQGGQWNYAVASGTANALTASLTPALEAYTPGLVLHILTSATNTGTATITINDLPPVAIKRLGGAALQSGDLPANTPVALVYDGTSFQVAAIPASLRGGLSWGEPGTYSWIVPDGVYWIYIRIWGAGGGGGGSSTAGNPSAGSAGAGGGYAEGWVPVTPGQLLPITVGAGGAGGGMQGGTGGTTSVGTLMSATGGGYGQAGVNGIFTGAVALGGVGIGGTVNASGTYGSYGFPLNSSSAIGGIGGGTFAGASSGGLSSGAGAPGNRPGGGGCGGANNGNGGAGAPGLVIISH